MHEYQTEENQIWKSGFVGIRKNLRAIRKKSLLRMEDWTRPEMITWLKWTELRQFMDIKATMMLLNEWRKRIQDAPGDGLYTWGKIAQEVGAMIRMSKAMTKTLETIKRRGESQRQPLLQRQPPPQME
jgi:hypothetical protein